MFRNLSALFTGLIFGIGLIISQMVDPAKVLGFLDIFGDWDPSLAFVMIGALIVTSIGYRLILKRDTPLAAAQFQIPQNRSLDKRLAFGAILFGIGWGLVGLCPGPAIVALFIGGMPVIVFLASMALGMALFEGFNRTI